MRRHYRKRKQGFKCPLDWRRIRWHEFYKHPRGCGSRTKCWILFYRTFSLWIIHLPATSEDGIFWLFWQNNTCTCSDQVIILCFCALAIIVHTNTLQYKYMLTFKKECPSSFETRMSFEAYCNIPLELGDHQYVSQKCIDIYYGIIANNIISSAKIAYEELL